MRKSGVIHFRRNVLDMAGLKTNIRAHNVLDATIEYLGPPKFSRQAFLVTHQQAGQPLLRRERIIDTLRLRSAQTYEHSSDLV
jgi:hypothetical protein